VAVLVGAVALAAAEKRGRLVLAAAVLAMCATIGLWELAPTGGRTFSSVMTTSVSASEPQHARWVLWDAAWRMFKDHPATGVGPGGYRGAFPSYFTGTLDGERDWGSAHDLYLHQLAERGLLGAAALLAVFGAIAYRLLKCERRAHSRWTLWALASWAAYLVLNVTETSFQTEQTATLALFAWACAEGERPRASKKL
jgi:O-antigen ligase